MARHVEHRDAMPEVRAGVHVAGGRKRPLFAKLDTYYEVAAAYTGKRSLS